MWALCMRSGSRVRLGLIEGEIWARMDVQAVAREEAMLVEDALLLAQYPLLETGCQGKLAALRCAARVVVRVIAVVRLPRTAHHMDRRCHRIPFRGIKDCNTVSCSDGESLLKRRLWALV